MIAKLNKMRTAALSNALGIALSWLILIAAWSCSNSLYAEDTASRIQAKISQVGAGAIKLRESGGDVSPFQVAMQEVDKLLHSGKIGDAEKILDSFLTKLGAPAAGSAPAAAAPAGGRGCDPRQPMTVSGSVTLDEDCTVGGDLTVTGNAVLHFDYTGRKGGRLVVGGNVIVRDGATG
jgi:hypothetical protein